MCARPCGFTGGEERCDLYHGVWRRGHGEGDVGFGKGVVTLIERHGLHAEFLGESAGVGVGSAGHHDIGNACLRQVNGGEARHFPCSHNEHAAAFEQREMLACNFKRHGGKRHGIFPYSRFRPNAFSQMDGALKQLRQRFCARAFARGRLESALRLPRDLGFAEHLGIERADYAEHVLHRIDASVQIEAILEDVARAVCATGDSAARSACGVRAVSAA